MVGRLWQLLSGERREPAPIGHRRLAPVSMDEPVYTQISEIYTSVDRNVNVFSCLAGGLARRKVLAPAYCSAHALAALAATLMFDYRAAFGRFADVCAAHLLKQIDCDSSGGVLENRKNKTRLKDKEILAR